MPVSVVCGAPAAAAGGVGGAPAAGGAALPGPSSVAAGAPRCDGPSTVAYTVLLLPRNTSTAMRPSEPPGKPPPEILFHVTPPSVDFHSPLPGPPPFMQHVVR